MNYWRSQKLDKKPQPGFKEEINLEKLSTFKPWF